MNKTTTRLAAIGGIVMLGAFAVLLAHNDARHRDRETPNIESVAVQEAVPIPIDKSEEPWGAAAHVLASKMVVRGNNDQLTQSTPQAPISQAIEDNPLRAPNSEDYDDSQVVLAGAGVPIEPPTAGRPTTDSPPSWLGGERNQPAAANAATQPATPPTLPAFPMASGMPDNLSAGNLSDSDSTGRITSPSNQNPLPSLAGGFPSQPPTFSSDVGDMSDTQRSALPPTNLMPSPGTDAVPFPASATVAPPPTSTASQPSPPTSQLSNSQLADSPLPSARPAFPANTSLGAASPATLGVPQSPPPNDPSSNALPGGGQLAPLASTPATQSRLPSSNRGEAVPTHTAALADLVSNQPGNRYLDGSQNPNMLIQKRAPEEIQVGKKATFVISVRNAGNATAHDVRVVDSVPQGSRFIDASPAVSPDAQGRLLWNLGEMAAGDERTITLQIVPEVQGEVGSNALVYFAAQASVRTVATLPKLEMQVQTLPEMLIGSRQTLSVVVKNTGTGVAREVRLEVDVPELLKHDIGEAQLTAPLGDMRPNEVRPITLDLTAVGPGEAGIAFRAVNDDGELAEHRVVVQVLAPQLTASITGPSLRYLERQATFVIQIANNGTTAATNLDFIAHLPPGMKFISATQRGYYEPELHAVRWGLPELPVQPADPIELTLLPVELGPQSISFSSTADLGLKAEAKHTVTVDGLAELAFTIGQDKRTIETGASSTYWVQVTNVGNKPDKDVRLAVRLPAGSVLRDVNAQVKYHLEGNQILFEPVPEMRNKDQFTYRFEVQHNQPGTQIVRTELTSSNWPAVVIKEEGTLVYNDRN